MIIDKKTKILAIRWGLISLLISAIRIAFLISLGSGLTDMRITETWSIPKWTILFSGLILAIGIGFIGRAIKTHETTNIGEFLICGCGGVLTIGASVLGLFDDGLFLTSILIATIFLLLESVIYLLTWLFTKPIPKKILDFLTANDVVEKPKKTSKRKNER